MSDAKQSGGARSRGLSWAIGINAFSWIGGVLVYVCIFVAAFRFHNAEAIDNVVCALNLIWVFPLLFGLWRLWRNPHHRGTLTLVLCTQSISLFYSIRSPLTTVLRYSFLAETQATIGMVLVDVAFSLLMAATTSVYLVWYCWQQLKS